MTVPNTTFRSTLAGAAAMVALLGLTSVAAGAAPNSEDTYEWSAALMSVDEAAGTAVFQARIQPYVHIDGLDSFEDGDRLTLVWSGKSWAAGIRDLGVSPSVEPDALKLPVEFVSTARDHTYLNFRVAVPAAALKDLVAMGPGARVTVLSPRKDANWRSAVVSLRQYNDVGRG